MTESFQRVEKKSYGLRNRLPTHWSHFTSKISVNFFGSGNCLQLYRFHISDSHERSLLQINQSSLYSRHDVEAYNEWWDPSPRLSAWVIQLRGSIFIVESRRRHCVRYNRAVIEAETFRFDSDVFNYQSNLPVAIPLCMILFANQHRKKCAMLSSTGWTLELFVKHFSFSCWSLSNLRSAAKPSLHIIITKIVYGVINTENNHRNQCFHIKQRHTVTLIQKSLRPYYTEDMNNINKQNRDHFVLELSTKATLTPEQVETPRSHGVTQTRHWKLCVMKLSDNLSFSSWPQQSGGSRGAGKFSVWWPKSIRQTGTKSLWTKLMFLIT